jgi:hypothetical protein
MTTAFFIHAVHTVLGKYTGKSPLELSRTKNKDFKVAQFSLTGFYLAGGSWDIESSGDS